MKTVEHAMKSFASAVFAALVIGGLGLVTPQEASAATPAPVPSRDRVCMMQDTLMAEPGIPVEYAGKTYYGCCPMCSGKILSEPERYTIAKDPVSGKPVDKATAALASVGERVFYFETADNRDLFARDPQRFLGRDPEPVTRGPKR